MDLLEERLAIARRALERPKKLPLGECAPDVVCSAVIQRSKYRFETIWKAAQLFLWQVGGPNVGLPKRVIRICFFRWGFCIRMEAKRASDMADACNLTVHTYNEALAQAIFFRLSQYTELMDYWLKAMEKRVEYGEQPEDTYS